MRSGQSSAAFTLCLGILVGSWWFMQGHASSSEHPCPQQGTFWLLAKINWVKFLMPDIQGFWTAVPLYVAKAALNCLATCRVRNVIFKLADAAYSVDASFQ